MEKEVETVIWVLGLRTMRSVWMTLRSNSVGQICAELDDELRKVFAGATTIAVDYCNELEQDARVLRLGVDGGYERVDARFAAELEACLNSACRSLARAADRVTP
jgi:hypothetical protein